MAVAQSSRSGTASAVYAMQHMPPSLSAHFIFTRPPPRPHNQRTSPAFAHRIPFPNNPIIQSFRPPHHTTSPPLSTPSFSFPSTAPPSGLKLFAAESALTTWPCTLPTRNCGSKIPTMLSSRHAVSLGCAPTPTQYRARLMSRRMSFHGRPCVSPGRGACGFGSYVPRTSSGRELRAVLGEG